MRVSSHIRQGFIVAVLGLATTLMSGCSFVYKTGANVGLRFTEQHLVPPMLQDDDAIMACSSGESITPLILGAGVGLGADDDQLSTLLYTTAALCSDNRALEAELRYMRASRANQVEEAQDARIEQKRWAELSARRQYKAYQHFEHYYLGKYKLTAIGDKCPKFRKDFDEMVYMLGLISGVQAVANDINSQNAVGVPKDIAAKTERAMQCLDNDKWFGVPMATRAAVWNLLPGAGEGHDPWETLKQSMRIGERKGVRLPHALYAMSAYAKADDARLRDAFKSMAATYDNQDFKPNPQFALFDKLGELVTLGLSDRYWTEHTGTRTPAGSLGKFWDDKPATQDSGVKIDDLL